MKRCFCSIFVFCVYVGSFYAQSYYMNEVAEDAGYQNDGNSFLSIIGLIIFILRIYNWLLLNSLQVISRKYGRSL